MTLFNLNAYRYDSKSMIGIFCKSVCIIFSLKNLKWMRMTITFRICNILSFCLSGKAKGWTINDLGKEGSGKSGEKNSTATRMGKKN